MNWIAIIGGAILGTALGWSLQSGGFCMNSAFRSIFFGEDKSLLRAWFLVLLINIPGVALLTAVGVVTPDSAPFYWPALILGGLVFGGGMVLAGGCASGTWYRAGRGMLGSWGALVGFVLASAAVNGGALTPLRDFLRSPQIPLADAPLTIYDLIGNNGPWMIVIPAIVVSIPLAWYLIAAPKQKFVVGWSWKKSGIAVGVIALAVWPLSAATGRNFGLSFTQPGDALADLLVAGDGSGIGLPAYMLLGVPFGAYLAAWRNGEARLSIGKPGAMVRQAGGGVMMGIGAGIAGGCNIGHGISGLSTLSVSSLLAVVSIMAGCWIATAAVIRREKRIAGVA